MSSRKSADTAPAMRAHAGPTDLDLPTRARVSTYRAHLTVGSAASGASASAAGAAGSEALGTREAGAWCLSKGKGMMVGGEIGAGSEDGRGGVVLDWLDGSDRGRFTAVLSQWARFNPLVVRFEVVRRGKLTRLGDDEDRLV